MRLALVLAFVAPLAAAQGMGAADARHLLARTGFEARLADVDTFARLSRREAVERLLASDVVWAKLRSLRDGARIASERLFG